MSIKLDCTYFRSLAPETRDIRMRSSPLTQRFDCAAAGPPETPLKPPTIEAISLDWLGEEE